MRGSLVRTWLLVLCSFAAACGGRGGGDAKNGLKPVAATAPPAVGVEPTSPTPSTLAVPLAQAQKTKPAISNDDAGAVITEWLAAQNGGDYERYAALYAQRFTGVRRTGTKVRPFDRAGWLADRKRMFEKPMQVAAGPLTITAIGPTTVVRFEQQWSTATYRDVGPKQIVLVREPQGVCIAREELLSSAALPVAASSARFVVNADKRSYVLIESVSGAQLGAALRVDLRQPVLAVFERASAAPPASVAAWKAGPVRLFGRDGSCEAKVSAVRTIALGYPHFGVVQAWSGSDGSPALPMKEVAADIAELGNVWTALEIDSACVPDPMLALPSSAPPAVAFATLDVPDEVRLRALHAFGQLPDVGKLAADERKDLLDSPTIEVFGRHDQPEWVTVSAATGCDTGLQQFVLFRVEGTTLVPQITSRNTELLNVGALLDLDGDGQPEIAGSEWVGIPWLLIETHPRVRLLQRVDIPYNDCPC